MKQTPNILTGLSAAVLGAVLVLWVIPAQTVPAIFATVPSGFYPNFTSGILIASGLALAVSGLLSKTAGVSGVPWPAFMARLSVALVLLVGAMFAAPVLGFLPTGVGVCLITLLLMREKRWLLVAAICVVAPLAVWVGFDILLGRPLP